MKKKDNPNKNNSDIRNFFTPNNNSNLISRRVQELITPYINEINTETTENYKLRERKIQNYKQKFEESDLESEEIDDEKPKRNNKLTKRKKKRKDNDDLSDGLENFDELNEIDDNESAISDIMNKSFDSAELENNDIEYVELRDMKYFNSIRNEAKRIIAESEQDIRKLEKEFYSHEDYISYTKSSYPEFCIPIRADIRSYDFKALSDKQIELTDRLFDVIMMDPPWQLSSSQPTRGVAIAYDTLSDPIINDIPVNLLQKDGFIFIWTINAKYNITLQLMKNWGYKYIDEIVWVKQTVNGKIAKGHGYYLQHTKETCLVGVKGNPNFNKDVGFDVIFSKRRGQSQKPEEIYERIEELVPNGNYLEIFGRRNNLRNYWVTIGNEL